MRSKLRALAIGLILATGPLLARPVQAAPVLRVGVADGSQPCSYRQQDSWSGLAVELWQRIADQEELPYVLVQSESAAALLEATRRGELDVAIGCLTVSPERLRSARFSLPFQESGLGVITRRNRLDLGVSLLQSLLAPDLIRLLLGYVVLIGLLSVAVWRVERAGSKPADWPAGKRRSFALIFQVLATGPGSNTVVTTTRGNAVVILAYLVRIVSASLLVGYLTVNVAREIQDRASGDIRSPADLRGRRVGVRAGTVSETLLKELNATAPAGGPKVTIVRLASIGAGGELLAARRIDALLGDNLQLSHLLVQEETKGFLPSLALEGIRPESQAFAYAQALPEATASRIDQAISALKRSGVVSELRQQATTRENSQGR